MDRHFALHGRALGTDPLATNPAQRLTDGRPPFSAAVIVRDRVNALALRRDWLLGETGELSEYGLLGVRCGAWHKEWQCLSHQRLLCERGSRLLAEGESTSACYSRSRYARLLASHRTRSGAIKLGF